jgi:hypothetical protein
MKLNTYLKKKSKNKMEIIVLNINKIKCGQCKRELPEELFRRNGRLYKSCSSCYENRKQKREQGNTVEIKGITYTKNKCKDCGKRAIFNFEEFDFGITCSKHKEIGMINVKDKRKCQEKNCRKQPVFNFEDETKGIYCKEHAKSGMIDIKNKRCEEKNCKKRPNFNFEDETKGIYCKEHAKSGMIDIKNKRCQEKDCKKIPVFNFENETKGIYCKEHAKSGMIDIKNKRCEEKDCKKQPSFNYENQKKAIYCKEHAKSGMIDIKNKRCQEKDCKKIPVFNFEDETKGIYCKEHSKAGMVDIISKRCQEKDCKKIPVFNFEDETKGIYCKEHAKSGMIDIKHKRCDHVDCKTRASYGFPCNLPNKCALHKEQGMIFNPNKKCVKRNCKENAIYGIKTPIHCESHKNTEDICLIERKCKLCDKIDVVNEEGICINFCLMEEKYKVYKKNIKSKELRVYNILKSEFGEPDFYDKKIENSCFNERPDIVYDMKTHFVIVEVDENQHRKGSNYNPECEYKRMVNIFGSLGGIPVIFIRYNPDVHKEEGKIVKLSKAKKEEVLIAWVKKARDEIPKKMCNVVYLFYDDYDKSQTKFYKINPYEYKKYDCENCEFSTFIKKLYKRHSCSENEEEQEENE